MEFFINNIDESKYKPIRENVDENEPVSNDFLNENEFAEIKGNYNDYGLGDLIILFPNPDDDEIENKAIEFREAEKVFDEILTVMTDEGISKS